MSVKIKSDIEKLENKYNIGADYIKHINSNVTYKFREAYIAKYVEYMHIIRYFETYIKKLRRYHKKNHTDIDSDKFTKSTFYTMYNNTEHTIAMYKAELHDVKDKIANCW